MTRVGLTERQCQLLAFIRAEIGAGRPAPSYDEMRRFMLMRSKSGVHQLIEQLVERGHIVRLPYHARSIALAEPGLPVSPPPGSALVPRLGDPLGILQSCADDIRAYAFRKGLHPYEVAAAAIADYVRRNP